MLLLIKNHYTNFIFILYFLLGCFLPGKAQLFYTQKEAQEAYGNIRKLRQGGLVVRFDTKNPLIENLQSRGLSEWANREIAEKKALQKEIMDAFKKTYKFGPVYFSNSQDISESRTDNVMVVRDVNGNRKEININEVLFLNPERVKMEDMNSYMTGFGVQDVYFNNLNKPFPYYVLKREGSVFAKKSYDDLVNMLQNNFAEAEQKLANNTYGTIIKGKF